MINRNLPLQSAGYPIALEFCSATLVAAQIFISWLALDQLPSTVVPYFSPSGATMGLPGAELEFKLWTWIVIGLWTMLFGSSAFLYRSIKTTPIPVISVATFSFLAVMRAGVIALNLNPAMSPRQALFRAVITGFAVLLLAAMIERWRTRQRSKPALVARASYDEITPRGSGFYLFVILGFALPLLVVPTRVRVIDRGIVIITPLGFFVVPTASLDRVERASSLQALFGGGINLASSPGQAVRLYRRKSFFPLTISVTDPDRFIEAVTAATFGSRDPSHKEPRL